MIDNRSDEQRSRISDSCKWVTLLLLNAILAVLGAVALGYSFSLINSKYVGCGFLASAVYILLGIYGVVAVRQQSLKMLSVCSVGHSLLAVCGLGMMIFSIVMMQTYEPDKSNDSYYLFYVGMMILLLMSIVVTLLHAIVASLSFALRRSIVRQCELMQSVGEVVNAPYNALQADVRV
ncbi:MAG: hypothetical protein MHM6MM_008515 [Cercozoa sp. M6MM]